MRLACESKSNFALHGFWLLESGIFRKLLRSELCSRGSASLHGGVDPILAIFQTVPLPQHPWNAGSLLVKDHSVTRSEFILLSAGDACNEYYFVMQQICSVLDALRGRVLPREKQDDQNTTVVTAGAQPEGHQVPSEAPSLAKRKRSEQEKEAVREKVARQRAAEQLKEQAESGRPVPILQPGV